jgi:type II secretion system protein H
MECEAYYSGATMRRQAGFTLIEILIVVLILAITATAGMDAIANTDATMRANRAGREVVAALRYARMMATTTGGVYGVEFDTTNKRFQVFKTTGSSVVNQTLTGGGTYVINLNSQELMGNVMTVSIANDATNPYDLTYSAMGSTSNSGTVVFTYGGHTSTVTIPAVGDPTIQ